MLNAQSDISIANASKEVRHPIRMQLALPGLSVLAGSYGVPGVDSEDNKIVLLASPGRRNSLLADGRDIELINVVFYYQLAMRKPWLPRPVASIFLQSSIMRLTMLSASLGAYGPTLASFPRVRTNTGTYVTFMSRREAHMGTATTHPASRAIKIDLRYVTDPLLTPPAAADFRYRDDPDEQWWTCSSLKMILAR
ncbi:hypothetical protein ACJ72_06524 [Emergomyces africanus]|uniref:Uncharacterized protein n=1 Tax=Emergomyces africanus TaxID=1955775 RepID=A0A1B7NQV6_9EURO|nr:hypothetical protein ACJ72_06524 [Emergomyces africanus]